MARPSFKPTPQQRKEVLILARIFLPQDQIAEYVGLRSTRSLCKHFAKELRTGFTEAIEKVAETCFEMAKSGEHPQVTKFWIDTTGSAAFSGAKKDLVVKVRSYVDQPPPGHEHEYRLTKDGEYMREDITGPTRPARKPKAAKSSTLIPGGEGYAQPEM